jgi:hypothetical protein
MSVRLINNLMLALALSFVGACSEEKAVDKEIDTVGEDDDETGEVTDDDDVEPSDDTVDPPSPARDSGVKGTGAVDAGQKPAATDARTPDTGSSSADTGVASTPPDGGGTSKPSTGSGMCCDDGDCLCHGPAPTALTAEKGPYKTMSYTVAGVGCIFYPTDAEAPFAAVAVSDGFTGTGGCGSFQTGQWGPLYASWGIVAMIINTGSGDQPNVRGMKLTKGIATFKSENEKSGSPLMGKLSGRYGTSGFSMGGGGTTYSSAADKTLRSSVAMMPWGPVRTGVEVPTLIICGSSDGTAPCGSHGNPAYAGIADTVPKMRIQIQSGHAGQPSSGGGESGRVGLAFQKVFLEGDTRWRPLLVGAKSEATNIK